MIRQSDQPVFHCVAVDAAAVSIGCRRHIDHSFYSGEAAAAAAAAAVDVAAAAPLKSPNARIYQPFFPRASIDALYLYSPALNIPPKLSCCMLLYSNTKGAKKGSREFITGCSVHTKQLLNDT